MVKMEKLKNLKQIHLGLKPIQQYLVELDREASSIILTYDTEKILV